MKKVFNYLFIAFISTILISSCVDNEFDEPDFPFNDPDITTNTTIQSIKALHSEGNYEVITEDLIFTAIVIANDSTGNFYKKIIVQDETGGIEILVDGRSLNGKYPVGRRVFVKAKGLTLGDDNNIVQLASLASEASLVAIPYSELADIVIGGSLNNPVVAKQMKLNQVSDADLSTLVQFVDVEFDSGDLGKTYADGIAKSDQNRILKDCNGGEFLIRTSGYAEFANDVLPDKNGELMCIVGKYRDDYQGYVRSTNDVDFQNDRCGGGTGTGDISFDKDFEDGNLASGGWTTQIVVGTANWEAYEFSGDNFGRISNFNGTANASSDAWLISPEVDLAELENPILKFKNACNYGGADMEVYVTDNYDGTSKPVLSDWTKLSVTLSAGEWTWVESGNISMENFKNKKVYVGFRYLGSDSDGKTWEVDDITMGEGGGVNPGTGIFSDDFEAGIDKWNNVSVLGDEKWVQASYGNPGSCAKISGYAGDANHANEDWLITPQLDLTSNTNVKLTFDNATKFSGNPMEVFVSTDYSGSGDPTGATWTTLSYTKSGGEWAWVESGVIDLSAYDGQKIYIGYKFTCTDNASATWEIDNVVVK